MELGEHEGDMGAMPLPMLVTSYGAPPLNIHESSKLKAAAPPSSIDHHPNGSAGSPFDDTQQHNQQTPRDSSVSKKSVRYRECLKNHAASIGGHAIDGCGDFMPSGDEGTLEALKCAACNCHRNFHRREVEGEPPCYYCYNPGSKDAARRPRGGMPPLMNPSPPLALPASAPRYAPPQQMIMALGHEGDAAAASGGYYGGGSPMGGGGGMPMMKKRFRTKFSSEQKEKMSGFAEKLGWRIQKHDEAAVQQFCMEVGVKRHVLKVWMHNNKSHILAKSNRDQCSNSQ